MRKDLAARRAQGEVLIRKRLERGKKDGDLPKDADLVGLARYLATVMQGMAVQAASGASRKELRAIASTALRAWPEYNRPAPFSAFFRISFLSSRRELAHISPFTRYGSWFSSASPPRPLDVRYWHLADIVLHG